jgi:cation diffusion facilitator CzcD-associated flavoprotein CzcO
LDFCRYQTHFAAQQAGLAAVRGAESREAAPGQLTPGCSIRRRFPIDFRRPMGANRAMETHKNQHFDVLIVGAGLSGIGAGYHLQQKCPGKSYVILEGRDCIGGTWDLFRYPGIRSDSDMYTLGYSFKPWTEPKAIADGPRILNYVRETAADNGIDRKIRFHHRVKRASWSSPDARWTVEAERTTGEGATEIVRFTCNFLFMCSGYYKYEEGYTPEFSGAADFAGQIVHPQKWPEDLNYAGKRVVVIGSGATAVTLVPEWPRPPRTSPCCSARRLTSSRGRRRMLSPTSCAKISRQNSPIT